MSKSNKFETALLNLIFNGTAVTAHGGSGDTLARTGAVAVTQFFLSLHHAAIGDTSDQSTNECVTSAGGGATPTGYRAYNRVAVERAAGSWSVANDTVELVADASFPQATNGQVTVGWAAIGTASAPGTTGFILYHGSVSPTILITNGVTPKIGGGAGASSITED